MVHQHFTSVPALSVAENVALAAGWPVRPAGRCASGCGRWRSGSACRSSPTRRPAGSSVGLKQRLEIVKALAADARILLLDEPTAVLAPAEADELLRVIGRLHRARRSRGADHPQARRGARRGRPGHGAAARARSCSTGPVAGQSAATLAAAMMGEGDACRRVRGRGPGRHHGDLAGQPARPARGSRSPARERLRDRRPARDARASGRARSSASRRSRGTASASCFARWRAGCSRCAGGARWSGPVGFIPEDRTTEGLIPELTLTENVVLGSAHGRSVDTAGPARLAGGAGADGGAASRSTASWRRRARRARRGA